jgi:phosphoribosylglycinamide formyltransferase-1
MIKNIAIFASGTGTNADRIIRYFASSDKVHVSFVLCNKPEAPVLEKARLLGVPTYLRTKAQFADPNQIMPLLEEAKTDLIVLAGFLLFVPDYLTARYDHRIINIHPALLPLHGGKGFYGHKVHQSVLDAKEKESGITIHYANDHYDSGDIIFQATCPVLPDDTADTLAARVHTLEYAHFPHVIEEVCAKL